MNKKLFISFILLVTLLFTSCNQQSMTLEDPDKLNQDDATVTESPQNTQTDLEIDEHTVPTYKFMLDDKLYVDTGEIDYSLKCGVMDRGFEKVIPLDEIPDENGEANFDSPNKGAQFGTRENRMVAYVDDAWHIFAHNENSFDGIEMKVTEATSTKVVLEITNNVRKEFIYGERFMIEYYDHETSQWLPVPAIAENAAFHEIGYILKAATTTTVEINYEWLYGALEPGTYRIIKDIIDSNEPGDFEQYWYMAEFTIN